jgi:aromatic-L-amino-acid decarboxylase
LLDALAVTPEYLRNRATDSGQVIDYRDWQVPLGRRFRSLKLWFVIRNYGLDGLRAYLLEHVAWAASFERWVEEDPRFEMVAPRTSALVCFRPVGEDALGRALMDTINASGLAYLTHTTVPVFDAEGAECGPRRFSLRLALGGVHTRAEHVRALWSQVQDWADHHLDDVQS